MSLSPTHRRSKYGLAVVMCGALAAAILGLFGHDEQGAHPVALAVVNGQAISLEEVIARTKVELGQELSDAGLQALLERALRSEVIFQRAAELRLVRNDAVLRGRLMQLVRELAKSSAQDVDINEQTLLERYEKRKGELTTEIQVRFDEIFIRETGTDVPEAIRAAHARLEEGEAFEDVQQALGDRAPFDWRGRMTPRYGIVREYGEKVAEALSVVPVGGFSAPVQGNSGFHVLLVRERSGAELQPFADVRDRLERELRQSMEIESATRWVDELRDQAEIWTAPDAAERIRRRLQVSPNDTPGKSLQHSQEAS